MAESKSKPGPKPRPIADRFARFVRYTDDLFGCWLWTGSVNSKGYGRIWYPPHRFVFVHRLAWTLAYGPVPDGLCVLHRCDTPRCVRPDHLFLGTIRDNNHDMMRKGRDRFRGRPSCRTS